MDRFSEQNVLVLGDFMLDEYIDGSVERISPEAPVPIVKQVSTRLLPGGAGNVVCNLRALECNCYVVGMVGVDEGARHIKNHFTRLGLLPNNIGLIENTSRPTTRKTRIMSGNHQMLRLDRENTNPVSKESEKLIIEQINKYIEKVSMVVISDYDKGLITPGIIEKTVEIAHAHNCFIAVDPQITHFHYYQNVDVLTPNHHEAGNFLGRKVETKEEIEKAGFEIMKRLNSRMLLITRGENGMSLFDRDHDQVYHVPTMAREVFDVTGAGDTVISLFALAIAAGAEPKQSVVISNKAAGMVVAHVGAATVTVEELARELEK